jgi:hypothetical protein
MTDAELIAELQLPAYAGMTAAQKVDALNAPKQGVNFPVMVPKATVALVLDGSHAAVAALVDPVKKEVWTRRFDVLLSLAEGVTSTATATANQTHTATVVFNGASSSARLNGVDAGTGNPGVQALNGGTLVGCASGGAFFFQGTIAEICWYSGVLSPTQISSIESYLMAKWGTP